MLQCEHGHILVNLIVILPDVANTHIHINSDAVDIFLEAMLNVDVAKICVGWYSVNSAFSIQHSVHWQHFKVLACYPLLAVLVLVLFPLFYFAVNSVLA